MKRRRGSIRPRQLSSWIRLGTLVVCLAVMAGWGWMELKGREAALQRGEEQAATLANSLAQHASDTFQMADLALVSLSRLLGTQAPTRSKIAAITRDMDELLRRVPRIKKLEYFEQSGWRLASSSKDEAVNVSRTEFFRHHRKFDTADLYVSCPVQLQKGGPWMIVASHRITRADGSFGGVLAATIESRYFSSFYASFDAGDGSRTLLMSASGRLLARYPDEEQFIGMDVSNTPAFQRVRNGETRGSMRVVSPLDGTSRISAFDTVGGQAMTVVASFSKAQLLSIWQRGLWVRLPVLAAFITALAAGGLRLATQADRRNAFEASLLELSRTDALTGLLNRRAFDEAIPALWQRCLETGRPMSVLMIDVDCFKPFNDTYGHQAGDTCLRIVGLSVGAALRPETDVVARYGGEEFAVILPDTAHADALGFAERIRAAIAALDILHAHSAVAPHVTVSIGCATEEAQPAIRAGFAELLADADRALYQAKLLGRDQVVSASLTGIAEAAKRLPASPSWLSRAG